MILTVTVNPLLEKRLYFDSTFKGSVNRCYAEKYYAGGKGINVSRQLNKLKIENLALTFSGGTNGKILRNVLASEGINCQIIATKNETRNGTLLLEKESPKITSYIGLNSEISDQEVNHFIEKLEKMIPSVSVVVLTGSLPSPNTAKIFEAGIELAHKFDKIAIVDTYGSHLKDCIDMAPFAMHNNIPELEYSYKEDFSSDKSKRELLESLYQKGVKLAFLTNGSSTIYASKFNFHYKITPPKIEEKDPLGSGDSFVAGIAHGIEKNLVFDEMLKNAVSLGAVNAEMWRTSEVPLEEMTKYFNSLEVEPLGKKMKIIDDTPNY